jgi:hypothetical protein
VPEVIDLESGKIYHVSEIFAKGNDKQHQQRMADETARIRGDKVRYHCPLCHAPLAIRAYADKSFYFRHPNDPLAECPYRYDNTLSPEQINAIKYDGARESARHRAIKRMLEVSLNADTTITEGSVHIEKTVKAHQGDWKSWRRPDVQALLNGKLLAFEIQLSTTFLTVIAGRREFYLKRGGLLFWIFDEEFLGQEGMRFTERDVFYNNNSNLFYLTPKTVAKSIELGECRLMCRWEQPVVIDGSIGLVWKEQEIGLLDLKLDFESQRAYFFDYDYHIAEARRELKRIEALEEAKAKVRQETEAAQLEAMRYEQNLREKARVEYLEKRIQSMPNSSESWPVEDEPAKKSWLTIEEIIEQQKTKAAEFQRRVHLSYDMPAPDSNTSENFGNFWIRAGLEAEPEDFQEVVWEHYHEALSKACPSLALNLPSALPKDYRHLLCALYSLREGVVIGTNLGNLRALENHVFANYRWFYRYFAFGIRYYQREEELKSLQRGSTCFKHILEYKANYRKPGYVQHRGLDPLINFLFPEMAG